MVVRIKNEKLTIAVESYGGELQSIKRIGDETEYLWQGSPDSYQRKAINIFPYVARLTKNRYLLKEKEYRMQPHGFIADVEMKILKLEQHLVVLGFEADDKSKEQYPYDFYYKIKYELAENVLNITFTVENKSKGIMNFGMGGHPGFVVPLEGTLRFEDYYLEFDDITEPVRIGMSPACFVQGRNKKITLEEGKILRLRHNLFDDDAIIFYKMSHTVTLKSDNSPKSVTVEYPDMNYLGIWHWPGKEEAYVCIEPWTSLPSRQDIVEDIEKQENLVKLDAGATYNNKWSIKID